MKKHHRASDYKFTGRKQSARGIAGLTLAILSVVLGMVVIGVSVGNRGEGNVYLGSVGVLSMLLAFLGLVLAAKGIGEEKSFKAIPVAGTVCSVLILGGWIALYVVGFLM